METIHQKSIAELKHFLNELNSDATNNSSMPRFLFRGQTQGYGNIKPTFARVAHDNILRGQAYTIYRNSRNLLRGLYGYSVESHEAVAILQHYGLPTPQIDLTHNADVAIYFATENLMSNDSPRIYIVDTTKLIGDVQLTNHLFLVNNIENNGLNNRWYRQDGYAIMHKNWVNAMEAEGFDLYDSKYSNAIKCVTFDTNDLENVRYKKNDIYNNEDNIPHRLKSILNIFCQHQFASELHLELVDKINNIDT